ncbi:HIT family protein [Candidatus Gribaldobacteria bacterium]|nr:HIT family protein [Candidatus Gribaldobacteria bacterium]
MECLFCQPVNPSDFICQGRYWNVFLAWDQTYLGRSIVALKRHCGDLAELEQEEWLELFLFVKKLEQSIRKVFGANLFNWSCLMNDSYQNNPPNPHLHWHLRPRYNREVRFAGLIFKDKEFGHHYERGSDNQLPEKTRRQIAGAIKESL